MVETGILSFECLAERVFCQSDYLYLRTLDPALERMFDKDASAN